MLDIDNETNRVTVFCDDCGEYHDSDLYDEDEAIKAAVDVGWLVTENKLGWKQHYCPNCQNSEEDED